MTLKPGKSSGSEPEGHKNSDQVLAGAKGEVERRDRERDHHIARRRP